VSDNREQIIEFLKNKLRTAMAAQGQPAADLSESFNFMEADVMDSLGFVRLIHELEQQFQFQLDLSDADPEQLVTLGGLADVAAQATAAS
jgi:acyl carrier protein